MIKPVALAFFLAAPPLAGQGRPVTWSFDADAGITTPTGGFDARAQDGVQLSFGATCNLTSRFGLRAELAFTDASVSLRRLQELSMPDGDVYAWALTLNPVLRLGGRRDLLVPYLTAGAGVARRTVEYTSPSYAPAYVYDPWYGDPYGYGYPADYVLGSFSQTRSVVQGGIGVEFAMGPGSPRGFVELRYVEIFTSPVRTTYVPLVFGVRF